MAALLLPLLLLFTSLAAPALVASQTNSSFSWRTLSGNSPLVVARGGFSGLFPSSSSSAYQLAMTLGLPDLVLWCDVRLTKDSLGICSSSLELKNTTTIEQLYPRGQTSYLVNGVSVRGWFPIDYTLDQLVNVTLLQGIYSRTEIFDGLYPLEGVEQVAQQYRPSGYWLNIQHDIFYREHNLSMRSYVLGVMRSVVVDYISSPEVGFLRSIVSRVNLNRTKLIFQFLGSEEIEPSTNQTYGSLLRNLTFVKPFASGILLPKNYIWPVNAELYLLPHTNIVADAHQEGLEVYASDFANDFSLAYNYSYDPVAEVLSFIGNSQFSVDGLLTDFPVSSSEAIACFANTSRNSLGQDTEGLVVISHNGASGDYPGSTNLAYQNAVSDGADIIDCSVQMTADGIPVCLNSIDLIDGTNVAQSSFRTRLIQIPEIQAAAGIFSFNLSWEEIRSLKPAISNPFSSGYSLMRNPAFSDKGEFLTLSEFLTFAKNQSVSGILLKIKHAAYFAEKQGLGVIDEVLKALNDSGLSNQTSLAVTIGSDDSSVLINLKQQSRYRLMYEVDELIQEADNSTVEDIRKFADYVAIQKYSVFTANEQFLTGSTDLVDKLHAFNLSVYVYPFSNEFVSQAWDFYTDPYVEINNYFQGAGVDGIITDFPATVRGYKRNSCLRLGNDAPPFMRSVPPGGLLQLAAPGAKPPAAAPLPVLTEADVSEPPFPPVGQRPRSSGGALSPSRPPSSQPSSAFRQVSVSTCKSVVMLLSSSLLILKHLSH